MNCEDLPLPKKRIITCGDYVETNAMKNHRMDWNSFRIQCPESYELAKKSFEAYQKLFKDGFQKGILQ